MTFKILDTRESLTSDPEEQSKRFGELATFYRRNYPGLQDNYSDIVSKIYRLRRDAEIFRQGLYRGDGLERKLLSDWRFYKGYDSQEGETKEIRFSSRLVLRMVRTICSEILRGAIEPRIEAQNLMDSERAEIANSILREQGRMNRYLRSWQIFTRDKALIGTGIMRKDWVETGRKVTRRKAIKDPRTGETVIISFKNYESFYKGWVNRNVQLLNFYWDPDGIDMETCGWVLERDPSFTGADILRFLEGGVFQIDNATRQDIMTDQRMRDYSSQSNRTDYMTTPPEDRAQPVFSLDRYYTDDQIFYILDDRWLMNQSREFQDNPFCMRHRHNKPYIHGHLYPNDEFLGEGLAETAGGYQFYVSQAVKLELQQIYSNLRRKLLVERGAIDDMTAAYEEVDDAIIVDDINNVKALDPLRTIGAALDFKDRLILDAENDTGIRRMMQGDRIGGNTTATEAAEIADQIEKQTGYLVSSQLESADEDVRMSCEFNYMFMDIVGYTYRGQQIQVDNELFDTSDLTIGTIPESFIANVSALKQKRLAIFAQQMAGMPGAAQEVNWHAVLYAFAKSSGLDPNEALTGGGPPPMGTGPITSPINQRIASAVQQAQLAGPGGGGGGGGLSVQPGGMARSNGATPPTGSQVGLAELNPAGMRGGGQPEVAQGEMGRTAVLGQ